MCENGLKTNGKRQRISLVGIGTGSPRSVTKETAEVICSCDCLIGARRMLETAQKVRDEKIHSEGMEIPEICEYRAEHIAAYIAAHPRLRHIAVLFSGDTGFYSGAKQLMDLLGKKSDGFEIKVFPGISSIVSLAAKLHTTWEDGAIVSLHGQDDPFIRTIHRNRKTFLLLGGRDAGARMLRRLNEYAMDDVTVYIGSRLTYPDERIVSGHPREISEKDAEGLSVALVLNPSPDRWAGPHFRDEEFIRGNVPMTKAEVRAVSIAELELTEDAVVYDIGAGTGSVSVEAACSGEHIRVYSVEKKAEAIELLYQNRKKFRADGIRIIEGEAPEVLQLLEPPTHVFIGGSSGNLREILYEVTGKNPAVRIVINAISLETLAEVMALSEEGVLKDAHIIQITAARSRMLGRYHMMTGQNPVYIISAGGKEQI